MASAPCSELRPFASELALRVLRNEAARHGNSKSTHTATSHSFHQPLRGEGEMTFAEIGVRLGISGVRARELYLKGMQKLRRGMR